MYMNTILSMLYMLYHNNYFFKALDTSTSIL